MAMTYTEVARRLGRQTSVQIDKRRGTEFRIAPSHLDLHGEADTAWDAGPPDLQVRYHGVPVVTFHPDGTYTLRTGGLATKTLLRRISEYAPISLMNHRGTVYTVNPDTGARRPFLEGMRIDARGIMVVPPRAGPRADDGAPGSDDVRALVSRLLDERLGPAAQTPPQTPPEPVRAVRFRATVTDTGDAPAAVPLPVVEQLMREAGLREDQITRVTRDLRQAVTRGRDGAEVPAAPRTAKPRTLAAAQDLATPPAVVCPDCGRDLRVHYDRANRFRGCTWALKVEGKSGGTQNV